MRAENDNKIDKIKASEVNDPVPVLSKNWKAVKDTIGNALSFFNTHRKPERIPWLKRDLFRITENNNEIKLINNLLFESIPQGLALYKLITNNSGKPKDYIFISINQAFAKLTGLNSEDIAGKSGTEIFPEIEPYCIDIYSKVALTGESFRFEHYSKKFKKHFDSSVFCPEPGKFAVLLADITDRKKAEEVIAKERSLLKTLIDNIPDSIYIKDSETRKILANRANLDNIGASSEADILGKTDYDIYPAEIAEKYYLDDKSVLTTGKPIINREEIIIRFGKKRTLLTSKLPLFDQGGNVMGLVGIGRDITERQDFLEELILAKEKAEESDRLKTSFLNNLSHEIRTPLNAIVGFSEFLTEPGLPSETISRYADIICKSSDQLLSIINDIINMASLETGQEKIELRSINVNNMLTYLYEQYNIKSSSDKLKIKWRTSLSDSEANIMADSTKLIQIITNLMNNAIRFTDNGEIEFGCDLMDDYLLFYIRDTGIGIPQEYHEIIFERFRKVNINDKRYYGGTGLGLSISKSFVELLGGKIGLESEPAKGSCFFFTTPYNPANHKKSSLNKTIERLTP